MLRALVLALGLLVAQGAQAATLLSSVFSGADLATAATPTANVSVNGQSATFSSSAPQADLFILDLLPAGLRGDLTITIDVTYSGILADSDLIVGVTDGT